MLLSNVKVAKKKAGILNSSLEQFIEYFVVDQL
jgi:hypothetical protein